MITIVDVKNKIKGMIKDNSIKYFTNVRRELSEKVIVILEDRGYTNPYGISRDSTYYGQGLRVWITWTKNGKDSAEKAQEIYEMLRAGIDSKDIIDILMKDPGPIFLEVNEEGLYEYIIDAELRIKR